MTSINYYVCMSFLTQRSLSPVSTSYLTLQRYFMLMLYTDMCSVAGLLLLGYQPLNLTGQIEHYEQRSQSNIVM